MRGNTTGLLKPILWIFAAVIGIIAIAFVVAAMMGGNKDLGQAVDFTAVTTEGESFTLSEHYQGGVALIFLDRTQGDGVAHLTNLAAAQKDSSVKTVLIALGEKDPKAIVTHLSDNAVTADYVIADGKKEIAALYNVTTCPITYFINSEGSVRSVSLSNLTPSAADKYFGYIEN